MLAKDTLEVVNEESLGFYSYLVTVEKAPGGWRLVIDHSPLNGLIRQAPFKMETVTSALNYIRESDFLAQ